MVYNGTIIEYSRESNTGNQKRFYTKKSFALPLTSLSSFHHLQLPKAGFASLTVTLTPAAVLRCITRVSGAPSVTISNPKILMPSPPLSASKWDAGEI